MSKLVGFLWKHAKGSFLLAVLAGILGGAGGVGQLALIPLALRAGRPEALRLGMLFAALCVVTVASRVAMQVAMIRIAQGSVAGLVKSLCARILALPLAAFEANDPGSITAVLTEDVVTLTGALSGVPLLVINLTVFLGCFVFLAYLSPVILLCTVVFVVPAVATHHVLSGRGVALMTRARAEQDALVGHFRSLVEGFKELRLHRDRREAFLAESVRAASERVRERNVAGLSMFAVVSGWGQMLYFGYLGFLVFVLPAAVDVPKEVVAAAVLTVVYAISPLDGVLNWLPVVARAGASMGRVESLGLTLESAEPDAGNLTGLPPDRLNGPLVVEGVTYAYPAEKGGDGFVLGPVDLTVGAGEMLFLVGGNGSGKTTLVKLLTGLYAPASGSIRWDGRLADEASIESYRQLFTVVFADGFLFPSLLGLNDPEIDARAAVLLVELGLDRVVSVSGGVFSTTALSQGQRKRLALLAACLEDRPILVLDEWASYQDPLFKKVFYLEILPALRARGKTLVVISHDEDYFFAADRVVHLNAGMLTGPPAVELGVVPGGGTSLPPTVSS